MSYIFPTDGRHWRFAKKTKSIQAKPMSSVIVDRIAHRSWLIDTLEGSEPIDLANMLCLGEGGEPWQQTPLALLKKYNVTSIDDNGWLTCTPKPENEVEFFQLEKLMLGMDQPEFVYIQGMFGETVMGTPNLLRCKVGDYVCRQPHDHKDQWVVRQSLFENTYTNL